MFLNVKRNTKLAGTAILLAIFMMRGVPLTCYADSATGSGATLRSDAPIYTGPVDEGDLEPLTIEDFDEFGAGSDTPADQYRQYCKALEQPVPGAQVLYKMRIVDRDLTLDDFAGMGVPGKLAQARYDEYLGMNPITDDGRTIHYVYVFHPFLDRAALENEAAEQDLSTSLNDNYE